MKTKEEIHAKLDEIQNLFNELSNASVIAYGNEYKLSEWLTPVSYAKKYTKSISTVQNWIARGVVPDACMVVIPELNNLRLIKDQPYQTRRGDARTYDTRAKALVA